MEHLGTYLETCSLNLLGPLHGVLVHENPLPEEQPTNLGQKVNTHEPSVHMLLRESQYLDCIDHVFLE